MAGDAVLNRARAIVMNCFYDELAVILRRQGVPSDRIDGQVLALYARTKLDASKYSPRFESR